MYKVGGFQVAIIIPAFNEESTIYAVVQSVKKYGPVIVVNDASTDNTKKISLEAGATVISLTENKGYDGALNIGFIRAQELDCNAIVTFDADGQHDPDRLKEYIECLRGGIDLVLGVRAKTSRIAEWIFALYTRIKFKWTDPLCGMKGYSMALYRRQGYFDSCNSIGTELAFYGLRNGFSYTQLTVPIENRKDSPRFYSDMTANFYILNALIKMIKFQQVEK